MPTAKRARKRATNGAAATPAASSTSSSSSSLNGFAKALTDYMVGEGKGPHDAVTLDDVIHAANFGGAAPDAKPARRPRTDDE